MHNSTLNRRKIGQRWRSPPSPHFLLLQSGPDLRFVQFHSNFCFDLEAIWSFVITVIASNNSLFCFLHWLLTKKFLIRAAMSWNSLSFVQCSSDGKFSEGSKYRTSAVIVTKMVSIIWLPGWRVGHCGTERSIRDRAVVKWGRLWVWSPRLTKFSCNMLLTTVGPVNTC